MDLNRASDGLNHAFAALEIGGLPEGQLTGPSTNPARVEPEVPSGKGELLLRRETAHRGGKTVVVVSGFSEALPEEALEHWAAQLKRRCGSGGTVKGREIEIQGEKGSEVAEFLRLAGFRVRGEVGRR